MRNKKKKNDKQGTTKNKLDSVDEERERGKKSSKGKKRRKIKPAIPEVFQIERKKEKKMTRNFVIQFGFVVWGKKWRPSNGSGEKKGKQRG